MDAKIPVGRGRTRASFDVSASLANAGGGRVIADVRIRQRGDAGLAERVVGREAYRDIVTAIENRLLTATLANSNRLAGGNRGLPPRL